MLPPEYEQQLRQLLRVFLEENQRLNLSAFRTEETCWIGNILDSLAFLDFLPRLKAKSSHLKALDLGTGGGFPLLPLAICLPQHHFTGVDATRKKVGAVERIVEAIPLTNVALFWGRAETLGKDPVHHAHYDIVLSRAVGKIPELLQLSLPFLAPGGSAVFWKSLHIEDELRLSEPVQKHLGFSLVATHRYTLPGILPAHRSPTDRGEGWGERQLMVFRKSLSPRLPAVALAKVGERTG